MWCSTDSTLLAAVLTTLVESVEMKKMKDAKTLRESYAFELPLSSPAGSATPFIGKYYTAVTSSHKVPHVSRAGAWSTEAVKLGLKSGQLQKDYPEHPACYALRAGVNRAVILRFLKVPAAGLSLGAEGQYVNDGTALSGFSPGSAVVKLASLAKVSALGALGFPLVKVEGEIFYVSNSPLAGAETKKTAKELLDQRSSGVLAVENLDHPFLYALQAVENLAALTDAIKKSKTLLSFTKGKGKNSLRGCVISEYATNEMQEKALETVGVDFFSK